MEPGAEPPDAPDDVDAAAEPTERDRAIRAAALGAALGTALAVVARGRPSR